MIQAGYKENWKTIKEAANAEALCLLECKDRKTGATVIALCATWKDAEGMINFAPLAKMFDGNPYDELISPMEEQETKG